MNATTLRIIDEATGAQVQQCTGPLPDGSCPRVAIGDILPCAGHGLAPAASGAGAQPYAVPGQATLCPVTLAAALAVASDAPFDLDD
ncbi:MAG: hypothetical protein JOZ75_14080 [Candidatus Dormibacteraeota bacterium]|nr:hypothetical protein [Candidatus Dormibacteraeota bacterium]